MFRLLGWLIGITLGTLTVTAFLLFTQTGNGLLQPLAENALQYKLPQAKITLLDIRLDHANLAIQLSQDTQATLNAKTDLLSEQLTGTWQLVAKDLTQLQSITPMPLAGAASSTGSFELSLNEQKAIGKLSLTLSQIDFTLSHHQDNTLTVDTQGKLLLSEITQLLQQPNLASGNLHLSAQLKLDDLDDKNTLNGTIISHINDGTLKAQAVQEKTGIALPSNTPFTLNTNTDVLNGKTLSQVLLNSPLAILDLTNLHYNLGEDGVVGEHQTLIHDLSKLSFITETPLYGRIQVNGSFTYTLPTHHIILDASSQILGGKITAKLNGEQFSANLHELQTTELATMLAMPVVFKSSLTGDLAYDLRTEQGKFDANLYDGQILPNTFSILLNNAAKFDMTREVYRQVHADGKFSAGVITTNMDMQSQLTHVSTQNAIVDLKQQQINATLITQVKGLNIPTAIQGTLTQPNVSVDLGGSLKKQAETAINEEINKEKQTLVDKIKKQLTLPSFGH